VPLIIGNNSREFPIQSADGGREMVVKTFGANADTALPLYGFKGADPMGDDKVLGNPATQLVADAAFRCPANAFGDALEKAGTRVWRYQFGVPAAGTNGPVAHNAELSYVFDAQPPRTNLASWPPVQAYWANFIETGDPNAKGLPRWPSMGNATAYMAFTRRGPMVSKGLRGEFCRLMNSAG
jgi:para-nitrobenzyl esterase